MGVSSLSSSSRAIKRSWWIGKSKRWVLRCIGKPEVESREGIDGGRAREQELKAHDPVTVLTFGTADSGLIEGYD